MQHYKQEGIEWLEFDLLADIPYLKQAIFLRHGGYSQGPFKHLNASYEVGDQTAHVDANLSRLHNMMQQDVPMPIKLMWAKQCHGKSIKLIEANSPQVSFNYDGLMTSNPGLSLMTLHADCQTAIFYDAKNHAIANVHSGWRGNVLNIYATTIEQMQKTFGSRPQELLVCISPSLGPDDAEFIHYNHELPEEFWSFQVKATYFDFWAISEHQLQQAGILPHHIEIARISTYANPRDYFSYRRQKVTGRHATCVMLI